MMIDNISIKGVTSYSYQTSQSARDLKRVNLFYGVNGSGKSTIARYLANPMSSRYSSCAISPSYMEEIIVYNQDFVKKNFWDSETQPGVFTVSEGNVEAERAIVQAEDNINGLLEARKEIQKKAAALAKNKEEEEAGLESRIWKERDKFLKTPLEYCMNGKNRKALFLEAVKLAGDLIEGTTFESLSARAKELNDQTDTKKTLLSKQTFPSSAIESSPVNEEQIVGSKSSYLSPLIEKIGNSDWVVQGQEHYHNSNGVCPFCQETPREGFKEALIALFDKTFEEKCYQIQANLAGYRSSVDLLKTSLKSEVFEDEYVKGSSEFEKAKTELLAVCDSNIALLEKKKDKPSEVIILSSTRELAESLFQEIDEINEKITHYNKRISDKTPYLEEIKNQFWALHKRQFSSSIDLVAERVKKIESDIQTERDNYSTINDEIKSQKEIISENRLKITNLDTSVENIKSTLLSIGVSDFYIDKVDGEEGLYKLVRGSSNDSEVYDSLSEGEKTLISFLYFVELCKGAVNPDSSLSNEHKIVVIDDPVSSLSHNYVYEIATIAQKEIVKHSYKQVFLLTHNLFFFHEMINQSQIRKKEDFEAQYALFRVSKTDSSKIDSIKKGDIKNEYESFWQVIRDAHHDGKMSVMLPNAMRNILEHYFGFVHKKDKLAQVLSELSDEHSNFRPLLRFINRESHSDIINITDFGDIDTHRFLEVFKQVFDRTHFEEHHELMLD
ncbi:MAG: AAA family ATPase [Oleiphilus sp.]